MNRKQGIFRGFLSVLLVGCIVVVYGMRLVDLQIVNGENYALNAQAANVRTVNVDAARGEILDRNGNPVVINRMGYSVVMEYASFPPASNKAQRNQIILELTKLLEARGEAWNDDLPLTYTNSIAEFTPDSDKKIALLKQKLELNSYATAQNCMDALIKTFELEDFSPEEQRTISGVAYTMRAADFSVSNPYTFAEDISDETVLKIKENSTFFQGVEVQVEPYREYVDGTLAPHVIGMVGSISAEEYAEKKDNGYSMNDMIGKDGIEKAMEDYLRGTKGKKSVSKNYDGNVTTKFISEPVQGDTVVLTLDMNLQRIAQNALQDVIQDLNRKYITSGGKDGGPATAGAIVVTDVNSGEILAMVSYPTYDISTYKENARALNNDPTKPLWNRATRSGYPPGSTYKPAVALAALQEKIITKDQTITCTGRYTFYKDYQPKCMGVHGHVNLLNAIAQSCNLYFFDVGRQTGIDKLNYWEKKLGFGQTTGVEIPEISGILAGKEQREAGGGIWQPGDTIQSCIGQSDNLMTPIQLANYCATIANGGTRYETHLVKEIKSYDYTKTVMTKDSAVACDTGILPENIDAVKAGMYKLTNGGYCTKYFADLPVKVAAKTGTAQVPDGVENGVIISYAPAEKPEIAISVVIEHAGAGANTAGVAAQVYDYYFNRSSGAPSQPDGILLP